MTYIPDTLRRQVKQRAGDRCEYCQLHQNNTYFTLEIDHIYAEKHGGATAEANLCVACFDCNRYKGSDLCSVDEVTGNVVSLFHPRRDVWSEHFVLEEDGTIRGLTPNGRVTIQLLHFNELETVIERARLIRRGRHP